MTLLYSIGVFECILLNRGRVRMAQFIQLLILIFKLSPLKLESVVQKESKVKMKSPYIRKSYNYRYLKLLKIR